VSPVFRFQSVILAVERDDELPVGSVGTPAGHPTGGRLKVIFEAHQVVPEPSCNLAQLDERER
jgi:hypothetical protein